MQTELQKQSLYTIRQDHYQLIQMIEDADGEVTQEIIQALRLNEQDFESKAISYGFVFKGFEDTEEIIDKEIKRLVDLKLKAQKRQELFKGILSEAMQQYNIEKIETPTLKLSFRKSEAIEIINESLIPDHYKEDIVKVYVSKPMIKEAIKEGKNVPGAELVTRKNLQIV